MAVIQNRATENGDVIFIKTDVPIIGIVALLSFIDDTENETLNTFFEKRFRYSVDGINWSPFILLTVDNVSSIEINVTDTLFLEYLYERVGDSVSSIAFNSVTLQGLFESQSCGEAFQKSILGKYLKSCNNTCSILWSINVLEKVYKKGILAEYIERNRSSSTNEDRDFIDYWRSITHYYALYVCLARYFASFYNDQELSLEFIRQRGLFVCDDATMQDITYLMNYYYDEIRQRGTIQITRKKSSNIYEFEDESVSTSISDSCSVGSISQSESLSFQTYKEVDGELLRLICYRVCDEFIFNLREPQYTIWNINTHSPLNRSLTGQINAIKGFETTKDVLELGFYPTINSQFISNVIDGDKISMRICGLTGNQISGIGGSNLNKAICIDQNLDYEITFFAKQTGGNLHASLRTYNVDGNQIPNTTLQNNTSSNIFFESVQITPQDRYVFIRLNVYKKNKVSPYIITNRYQKDSYVILGGQYYKSKIAVPINQPPDISPLYWQILTQSEIDFLLRNTFGYNLQFQDGASKILPQLTVSNGGQLHIWNFKIRPIATPYSLGFVQINNWIDIFLKNRNKNINFMQLRTAISRFLIPYNCFFEFVGLPIDDRNFVQVAEPDFDEDMNDDFRKDPLKIPPCP